MDLVPLLPLPLANPKEGAERIALRVAGPLPRQQSSNSYTATRFSVKFGNKPLL